jgi:class 3 adenylate cyclase
MPTRIKVIMFTDCVGSSSNKTAIGDGPSIELLRILERFTRDVAVENGAKVVKSLGDGHLLTFDSAVGAIQAGLELQQKVFEYSTTHKLPKPMNLRIGIDVGDVDVDLNGDVLGHFVDVAKRVEAAGHGIKSPVLFTERVCALLPPKAVEWRKPRIVKLKGSSKPAVLYQATRIVKPRARPRERLCSYLTGGFFQVLLQQFGLKKDKTSGLCLRVNVGKDLEVITTGAQKQEFFKDFEGNQAAREKLIKELNEFARNGGAKTFECRKWPLRYANGGALPIVKLNGIRYICLFYRDIYPMGWNIANGGSDSYAELYFPDRIIKREFGEEFVVADHDQHILKFYEPGPENISPGYQKAIVTALNEQFRNFDYASYKCRRLDVKWLAGGPDRVTVGAGGDSRDAEDLFLSITPDDNAIEVDRIAYLVLDGDYCFIDGEVVNGRALGRMVGLFRFEEIENQLANRAFKPNLFFVEGQPGKLEDFERLLQHAIRNIRNHRRPDQRESYQACTHKYDLCPIARTLMGRFFASLNSGKVKFPDEA